MTVKKLACTVMALVMMLCTMGTVALAAEPVYVAKVGETGFASIDEAVQAWTNGKTLTLLSDVQLSDVITLKSTEKHILQLGTFTMTAASGKDAITFSVDGTGQSANLALEIYADATNPGGINAPGKSCIITNRTNAQGKDRPLTRIYGGVFSGSYAIKHSTSNGTNAPVFEIYGGTFNAGVRCDRATFIVNNGTFNGSIYLSVDSSSYCLIKGGKFKSVPSTFATLNSSKWTYGTAKGTLNGDIYVDADGYYVVKSGTVSAKPGNYEASTTSVKSSTFTYSAIKDDGGVVYCESVEQAMNTFSDVKLYTAYNGDKTVSSGTFNLDATEAAFGGNVSLQKAAQFVIKYPETAPYTGTVENVTDHYEVEVSETISGGIVTKTFKSYEVIDETNATVRVEGDGSVAYFKDFSTALASCFGTTGKTVVLMANVNNTFFNTNNATTETDVTIDLNGYTWSSHSGCGGARVASKVTIVDSSDAQTGLVKRDIFTSLTGNNYTPVVAGGNWVVDPSDYVIKGYTADTNADGTYFIREKHPVCEVYMPASTMSLRAANLILVDSYETLEEAFAAAQDGYTVKLIKDIEVDKALTTEADIIFDLGGKTITGKDTATGSFTLISVKDDTHLTVTDSVGGGKITLKAENNRAWNAMSNIFENRGSELTIEGGTFEHLGGTDMAFVVNVNANSYGDATLNVEGGELSSSYIAVRLFMDSKSSNAGSGTAVVNVSDGTLEGPSRAIWAQAPNSIDGQKGTINVSGGTVSMIDTARSAASVVNTTISGGTVGNIKAEKGEVKITDGTITGILTILDADGNAVAEDTIISGGKFVNDPSGYEAEGFDTFNTGASDTPFMVEEKVAEKVKVVFAETGKAGVFDIQLVSEDAYEIYEFVAAELTFKNASKTNGGADMQYEISGVKDVTSAEENFGIENDADERTFNFRLVNYDDVSDRLTGKNITIGQIKFIGESDNGLNLTVTGEKVAATKRGTNDEDWYKMEDGTLLAGAGIVGGAAVEAKRDVVVNVAFIHDLNPGHWQNNDLTVTLKDAFGKEYDAQDISDGLATFTAVPLGRITVTLSGAGFRTYPYTTVMEESATPLVLNFWNDVKRERAEAIEEGKGTMPHNFLVGDIVMDYTVDEYDLAAVTSYYGMYDLTDADKYMRYDLNRDGNIDIIDVAYVLHTLNN